MARHDDSCERGAPDDVCNCRSREAELTLRRQAVASHDYLMREMQKSLAMFFTVHDDPETAYYEPPLAGGDRQLQHLARWMLGEGWIKTT